MSSRVYVSVPPTVVHRTLKLERDAADLEALALLVDCPACRARWMAGAAKLRAELAVVRSGRDG